MTRLPGETADKYLVNTHPRNWKTASEGPEYENAWALGPEVLFLDEPTANLDPGATREVESIIGQIRASGTKIVMTTHSLGQARRLGDEILFLSQGRLVERAAADRFFRQPVSPEAGAFLREELPQL